MPKTGGDEQGGVPRHGQLQLGPLFSEDEKPALEESKRVESQKKLPAEGLSIEKNQTSWDISKLPPMLRHYLKVKSQYKSHAVLFQVGDFYEVFFDDAPHVADVLDIRLTSRNKDNPKPIPMCGIPIHALDNYLPRLLQNGLSVVIVSQTEAADASKKGPVKRELTRVVTPGVRYEGDGLEERSHNFLAAGYLGARETGVLLYVDVSTGHLALQLCESKEELLEALGRVCPSELLLPKSVDGVQLDAAESWVKDLRSFAKGQGIHLVFRSFQKVLSAQIEKRLSSLLLNKNEELLKGLSLEACSVLDAALDFIEESTVGLMPHFSRLSVEETNSVVVIDAHTRRNLELLEPFSGGNKKHSLVGSLDSTKTAMGARLLSHWVLLPSNDRDLLNSRYDAVEELIACSEELDLLRENFSRVRDIERILSRVIGQRANPKDLLALADSLSALPDIYKTLSTFKSSLFLDLSSRFDTMGELAAELSTAVSESAPTKLTDGGIFVQGYNADLDTLMQLSSEGKSWVAKFGEEEKKRTAIASLKVKYNNVFGYFIEVSKTQLDKIPDDYERRQTLVNAERFITASLKEKESAILSAKARQVALEQKLFVELRNWVATYAAKIKTVAEIISQLDVLSSFAYVAKLQRYCRPQLVEKTEIEIKSGRHPVVERVVGEHNFVSNSCDLSADKRRFAVLTGPNMGGKSTYLRQIGLIQIMAQAGSFVPAEAARLCLVDRIFTRIGAGDDLTRGDSTFMVEMREATSICKRSTEHSLVLIDEIGRGTATTDGLAIAASIAEWLHDYVGCLTVFATHFHELTELAESKSAAFCLSVGVVEKEGDIEFTHRIEQKPTSKSYGIEVAKLAGLPQPLIERAREFMEKLDGEGKGLPELAKAEYRPRTPKSHKLVIERISSFDENGSTPLEALCEIVEIKKMLKGAE